MVDDYPVCQGWTRLKHAMRNSRCLLLRTFLRTGNVASIPLSSLEKEWNRALRKGIAGPAYVLHPTHNFTGPWKPEANPES